MFKYLIFITLVILAYQFTPFTKFDVLVTDEETKVSKTITFPNEKSIQHYEETHPTKTIEKLYPNSKEFEKYLEKLEIEVQNLRRDINLDHEYFEFKYYKYDVILAKIEEITSKYAHCSVSHVGQSLQSRDIVGVKISSDSVEENSKVNPAVAFVANVHGDEVVGIVLMINLIEYLCVNYESNQYVTNLIDEITLYIVPSMNPDGYSKSPRRSRGNARGIDLNRNFPDQFRKSSISRQIEVQHMMTFPQDKNIILAAHFHGGAICVSYAWDGSKTGRSVYSATPDDEIYKYISLGYSSKNPTMHSSSEFRHGITNGAAWYPLYGGIQDYWYITYGIVDVTVELSNWKTPPENSLDVYWNDNFESIITYASYAYALGIRGIVENEKNETIPNVTLRIKGNGRIMKTNSQGMYYKLLTPGTYTIVCYITANITLERKVTLHAGQLHQKSVNFSLYKWEKGIIDDDDDDDDDLIVKPSWLKIFSEMNDVLFIMIGLISLFIIVIVFMFVCMSVYLFVSRCTIRKQRKEAKKYASLNDQEALEDFEEVAGKENKENEKKEEENEKEVNENEIEKEGDEDVQEEKSKEDVKNDE